MKEMTDRKLTDKIRQVFDDFEDPTAEQGWKELRKKYPESDKQPVLLWWGAAAALVVLCGLWFISPEANLGDQKIADKKSQAEITNGQVSTENNGSEKAQTDITNNPASPSENSKKAASISQPKLSQYDTETRRITEKPQEIQSQGVEAPAQSSGKSVPLIISNSIAPQILTADSSLVRSTVLSLPQPATAGKDPEITRDSIINVAARMLPLAKQNSSPDNHGHRVEETPYSSRKTTTKNHSLSVYAGSYFNYSLGSETKLNLGAGFTSDIRLTSNLRLSTGLGLAKNSLTYDNGVPSSSQSKSRYDAVPSFGISNGGQAGINITVVSNYDASLLALDIPVNVKYLIIPQDNKLYLLAGLSSGIYLSEKYSSDYRNYSSSSLFVQGMQGTIEVKKQLQAFDLARTLNISFGYSTNLGKSQNITIEPFLKYPLSGLGSEDLKFGATGINLKLNFSKFKK